MPVIDLDTQTTIEKYNGADVVIVGAGAVGILLAVELHRKGHQVVVIESGHLSVSEEKQQLNQVINTSKVLDTALDGRFRAIGGTTVKWGGGSSFFDRIDFENRSWVPSSGWPITYEDVHAYFEAANRFMGLAEEQKPVNVANPGFDPDHFQFGICRWAPEPNFYTMCRAYLQQHVPVLYNAVATRLHYGPTGDVERLTVANFKHAAFALEGKRIILANGGIESTRLLLANRPPKGHSAWLGKMFMEHLGICVGRVRAKRYWHLQKLFNTHFYKKGKYSIRIILSEAFQRKHQVLNCIASMMFSTEDEAGVDPFAELKNLRRQFSLGSAARLIRFMPSLMKAGYTLTAHGFIYKPGDEGRLVLMVEQEPSPDSFIGLAEETDAFGVPKAQVHWSVSKRTWKTIVLAAHLLKAELERLGLAKVTLEDGLQEGNPQWPDRVSGVNHHMGGVRMSRTPQEGVVDTNLRVWGCNNLFVCSSSVFPTGSHSNPTIVTLALGLRLVDHLSAQSTPYRPDKRVAADSSAAAEVGARTELV